MADSSHQSLGPSAAIAAHQLTMDRFTPLCRITVTVRNGTLWHRKPLYVEIVGRAKRYGLASANVFHAIEGFSRGGPIATSRLLSFADHLPLSIVIVDEEERILGFLASLEAAMECESIVMDRVYQFS